MENSKHSIYDRKIKKYVGPKYESKELAEKELKSRVNSGWSKSRYYVREYPNYFGIYNTLAKEFQFGIKAKSEKGAFSELKAKIGDSCFKWRFEIRPILDK